MALVDAKAENGQSGAEALAAGLNEAQMSAPPSTQETQFVFVYQGGTVPKRVPRESLMGRPAIDVSYIP